MASYTVDTVIEAPREVVYDIFADRERNEFLPVQTKLKTPGTTERQGVGAVHTLGFGKVGISEQITKLVPNERIEYKIVAGAPVKSHTGTIVFDAPGGTRVVYSMDPDAERATACPGRTLAARAHHRIRLRRAQGSRSPQQVVQEALRAVTFRSAPRSRVRVVPRRGLVRWCRPDRRASAPVPLPARPYRASARRC